MTVIIALKSMAFTEKCFEFVMVSNNLKYKMVGTANDFRSCTVNAHALFKASSREEHLVQDAK